MGVCEWPAFGVLSGILLRYATAVSISSILTSLETSDCLRPLEGAGEIYAVHVVVRQMLLLNSPLRASSCDLMPFRLGETVMNCWCQGRLTILHA